MVITRTEEAVALDGLVAYNVTYSASVGGFLRNPSTDWLRGFVGDLVGDLVGDSVGDLVGDLVGE